MVLDTLNEYRISKNEKIKTCAVVYRVNKSKTDYRIKIMLLQLVASNFEYIEMRRNKLPLGRRGHGSPYRRHWFTHQQPSSCFPHLKKWSNEKVFLFTLISKYNSVLLLFFNQTRSQKFATGESFGGVRAKPPSLKKFAFFGKLT